MLEEYIRPRGGGGREVSVPKFHATSAWRRRYRGPFRSYYRGRIARARRRFHDIDYDDGESESACAAATSSAASSGASTLHRLSTTARRLSRSHISDLMIAPGQNRLFRELRDRELGGRKLLCDISSVLSTRCHRRSDAALAAPIRASRVRRRKIQGRFKSVTQQKSSTERIRGEPARTWTRAFATKIAGASRTRDEGSRVTWRPCRADRRGVRARASVKRERRTPPLVK